MAAKSLQRHILRLISVTLLVVSLAILLAVWFSTGSHVRAQINNNLEVGHGVLRQLLTTREQQLLNSAAILTADFGFRQAVASGDAATAHSALVNQGARIQADLMVLMSLQGTITASTVPTLPNDTAFPHTAMVSGALQNGSATAFVQLGNDLYQIILLPVNAPVPVALTAIGFRMNAALAQELKQITHLDVTFAAQQNQTGVIVSTLAQDDAATAIRTTDRQLHWRLPFSSRLPFTTREYPLDDDQHIGVYLSASVDSAFAQFDMLQIEIILITLVAIALSLLGGMLFARKLTLPLKTLAGLAADIAAGHYRRDVTVTRNVQEIGNLMRAFNTMQADLGEREARIIYQAHHDPLTGLINRQHVITLLDDMLHQTTTPPLLIACLNILDFRSVNDTFGHHVGDACLRQVSERLQLHNSNYCLAARLGGDEFLLVAPQNAAIQTEAAELLAVLEQPYSSHEMDITLRFSMGVAASPQDAGNARALIQKADIALDLARRTKKGIAFYERKMEEAHLKRLSLLADLKAAIHANDGQLKMYYQPKICARTLTASRFEALIRWIHPHHGFVAPDMFIPLAEQAGLINSLTEWIVAAVIRQLADWKAQDFNAQVAVNLSAQDLSREILLEHINNLLQQHDVTPDAISFEITESELMRDAKSAIALLEKFRAQGFHLAIDDFGTGYSSLSQLKNMPVTELKIDRSFVMQLDTLEDDQIIVKSTIDLAHSFNLEIVAEGVENQAALNLLAQWGIDWIQGYYFSRPLPAGEVLPWVIDFTARQVVAATSQTQSH